MVELCPRCVSRPIDEDDEVTGWCNQCSGQYAAEKYQAKQREEVSRRRDNWRVRTDSADAIRERQRAHRLRARVRPEEPASPDADPWELADDALRRLERVRKGLGAKWYTALDASSLCDEIAEAIKQLATGP